MTPRLSYTYFKLLSVSRSKLEQESAQSEPKLNRLVGHIALYEKLYHVANREDVAVSWGGFLLQQLSVEDGKGAGAVQSNAYCPDMDEWIAEAGMRLPEYPEFYEADSDSSEDESDEDNDKDSDEDTDEEPEKDGAGYESDETGVIADKDLDEAFSDIVEPLDLAMLKRAGEKNGRQGRRAYHAVIDEKDICAKQPQLFSGTGFIETVQEL